MAWQGKRLESLSGDGLTASYTYDEQGIRSGKTINGVTTSFSYNGSLLMAQVAPGKSLLFSYDANGQAISVNYNGTEYYYLRNGQNDIVGLMDESGVRVVEYIYDAWGKLISTTGTLATTLGADNPFRYRGYYYDTETGLYYLTTRYYDPEVCRFISADVYMSTGQGVLGGNMWAYCGNNPVNRYEVDGKCWNIVIGAVIGAITGVVSQVVSDALTTAVSGELTISNWQTYVGAFVGGAVGGAILGGTGNVGLANAASGFVTTGVGLALEKATGVSDKSWAEIGVNAIADGAISYGLGKLPGLKKVTKGRNSMSAVYKSGLTKLRNGTARRMSLKVMAKGALSTFIGNTAMNVYYGLKQYSYDRIKRLCVR